MRLLIPLFSPATGTWGGLTRVISIAQTAIEQGHQVAFCASGYLEQALRERNYTVYSTPSATMMGLPAPLSRILEQRSQRASIPVKPGKSIGNIWMVLWLSGYAKSSYLHCLLKAELQAIEDFKADRLFTDLDPAAFLSALITGVPLASAYAQIITRGSGSWPWKRMSRALEKVLSAYGLPAPNPDELVSGATTLKIIPSVPELDGADPNRPDVRYVGHLIAPIRPTPADFQLQFQDEKRYVFTYVGTGSLSLKTLEDVLPRVFPAGGKQRCFVGAQSIAVPYRLEGVEFHPYLPAEALLPRCDWTICHGGQNTIIQSLLHGVPLIIFPGPIFERRFNAQKVEAAQAGLMGEVNQFTPVWLRAAFKRQAEFASQAAALGKRLRSYGGAPAAVDAIANWRLKPAYSQQ